MKEVLRQADWDSPLGSEGFSTGEVVPGVDPTRGLADENPQSQVQRQPQEGSAYSGGTGHLYRRLAEHQAASRISGPPTNTAPSREWRKRGGRNSGEHNSRHIIRAVTPPVFYPCR